MRVKDGHWSTARSFARGDQIAGCVVTDIEFVFAQQRLDVARALLLVFRRRVDLGDGNPLAQDRVAVLVDEFKRRLYPRVFLIVLTSSAGVCAETLMTTEELAGLIAWKNSF